MTKHQTINEISLQILAYRLQLKVAHGAERYIWERVILDLEKLRNSIM